MPNSPKRLSRFWQELKRRRVIHIIVVYATAAFIIIELVNNVYEPLRLPDWTPLLVIVILAIGFPIAIIISWIFDISLKGVKKAEPIQQNGVQSESTVLSEKPPVQEKSIIVLPFENISPDPDQEYFSDGLTEEIITDLSHIHDILVISRSSAMTFKGTKKKIREIAVEVNVRYILEGSVRKAGNNIRITAQLIDALTDAHLWAEKYKGTLDDVFDIQEKVSRSIVNTLKIKLSSKEKKKIAERSIDDVKAQECYLKANHELMKFTQDSLDLARQYLLKGLDLVGDNALLYSALGKTYYFYHDCGFKIDDDPLQKAEELAQKAYALNPNLASIHFLFGMLQRGTGNLKSAVENIKRAIEIDPDDTNILLLYVWAITAYIGKSSKMKPFIIKLIEIDPYTPINYIAKGLLFWMEGDMENAINISEKALEIDPGSRWAYFWMANFLARSESYDSFQNVIDLALKNDSSDLVAKFLIFCNYAVCRDKEKALNALTTDVRTFAWNDPEGPWLLAGLFSIIDEKEQSLDWLERAVDRGWINYPLFSERDPFLENIRNEIRFKELMEKVKHEWENFEV